MTLWNTFFDWAVTISGVLFLAQIITMGYRVARQSQISAGRRKTLLSGCIFLSVCLLLASLVFLFHGPVHVAPGIVSLVVVSPIILTAVAILGCWFRALRLPGLK